MHKALVCSVLALGLVLPASAVGKTASSPAAVTTSRLTCADFLDGNGKVIDQQIGFYFQVVNGGAGGQVVNLEFALPTRYKPLGDPLVVLSSPMAIGEPKAPNMCLAPKGVLSAASKARCHSAPSALSGLKNWVCPNVKVPAGRWRWLGLKVPFAKPGNRWTRFWAANDVMQTQSDTISTGT